jgi:hypothetical protein
MRFLLLAVGTWFAASSLQAQTITSVSTRWSDSFVEWEVYAVMPPDTIRSDAGEEEETEAPEEELYGEFKLRWLNVRDDFSEWDYEIGDERGTIRQKWKDDISQWELRSYEGNVVTMRTMWSNDLTEWRVTDNSITLNLKSKWKNQFDEWLVDDPARGVFYLYTYLERDPRDWAIEDALNEEVSQSMKMAMIFLTVFCGSPKM